MAKIGLITIVSIVLNLFLSFWLINQYMSDVYFQAYVNGTIGQYYPFVVLTLGVGGGSGLGYFFLKRKHGDTSLVGKIQKSKSFKPSGPFAASTPTAATKQILPTGAPPTTASKHTAYAVPPLPKSTTPSGTRSPSVSTWAAAGSTKSSLESILSPKQDNVLKPGSSNIPTQRTELPRPGTSSFTPFTETQPPQPLKSIGEPSTKQSAWAQSPPAEGRPEGPIFQKPGMDLGAKQDQPFSGPSNSALGSSSAPVPPKWAPPENRSAPQFPEGGVRSIPPLPTKWTPPTLTSQDKPPPQQGFPRPSPGPGPGPAPFPSQRPLPPMQGGPRPFVVQGPGGANRPGEQRPMGPPRPIAAPQPFRPDPNRPPLGIPGQTRPPPAPRPAAPIGGPMPQPWTPPPANTERKDYSSSGISSNPLSPGQPGTESGSAKQGGEPKTAPEASGGGGEMDWDTALDTILKTLRKDRVGDTK